MPKTPLCRKTIHRYEPSTRQQQAGVKELSVTQWHTTGVTKFEIRTHHGRHLGSGKSVADAEEKLWNRLQHILPKDAHEDKNVGIVCENRADSDEENKLGRGHTHNDVALIQTTNAILSGLNEDSRLFSEDSDQDEDSSP